MLIRMKRLRISTALLALGLLAWTGQVCAQALPQTLVLTRFGEIRPEGWMLRQMQADLDDGLAGHYPDISDTVNGRMFATQTANLPDANGNPGWWGGEHEGYYDDGLFRLAWLAGDATLRNAAIARLQDVLAAQDTDGYIGVYPVGGRFGTQDLNDAELWTQSRMFQALLAWYEASGDQHIIDAVERAAKLTLNAYIGGSYFTRYVTGGGGVSHGVGFADTLEWLYRLTGDDTYRNGYLWLYADYASSNVRDDDIKPAYLADPLRPWYKHTPHTAESLAMPAIAYAYGGPVEYAQAADQVLVKLRRYSNPGGGPVGDESVAGRSGSFDLTSEYCSMTESIASLNRMAQFRDAMATGDIAERIALNDAQGARLHPSATAVTYLTADNRASALMSTQYGDRLLFSASHQAAACCSLNSTRLLPYYVEGMWLKQADGSGLVARLYGPATLNTTLGGVPVQVMEATDFPFSDTVTFTLTPNAPSAFTLTLRVPAYAPNATVIAPSGASVVRWADRFEINATWNAGDTVALDLSFAVHAVPDSDGKIAIAYGPLLYALPIDAVAIHPGRVTSATGSTSTLVFQDTEYEPASSPPAYLLPRDWVFTPVALSGADVLDPWSRPPTGLAGALLAPDGSHLSATLIPLGATILRTTGFATDVIFADPFGD